jgi:membrane-bound metal-dependent hydrolase YbcI (DUF457 family)
MTWCKHAVIGLILFAILLYEPYRLMIAQGIAFSVAQ